MSGKHYFSVKGCALLSGFLVCASVSFSAVSQATRLPDGTYVACDSAKYMQFGKQGWIFEPWEFSGGYDPTTTSDLVDMNDAFKNRGVNLVLVPVPGRVYKYASQVDMSKYPNIKFSAQDYKDRWEAMIESVKRDGLTVVNLIPVIDAYKTSNLKETFFYPRDHHWTTSGAQISSNVTSEVISDIVKSKKLNLNSFKGSLTVIRQGYNSGSSGDNFKTLCKSEPDHMPAYQATNKFSNSLLEDVKTQIFVMGDSFGLASPDNNFATFLESATGLPTANYSVPGAGSFGALTGYLADKNFVSKLPPFVVVPFLTWMPSDPTILRQITAELNGCKTKLSQTTYTKEAALQMFTPDAINQTSWNLIHIYTNKPTSELKIKVKYVNGDGEEVTFNRSNSNYYKGDRKNFYITLPKNKKIQDLKIEAAKNNLFSGTVEICATHSD